LTRKLQAASFLLACVILGYIILQAKASVLTGDLNGDGIVNILDLSVLLSAWGTTNSAIETNLGRSGPVDIFDLSILLDHWGETTPTPTPTPTSPTLSFDDEFSQASGTQPSTSLWKYDTGIWNTGQLECYTNSTNNIEENGTGDLVISAQSSPNYDCSGTTKNYTSARLETSTTFSQEYGTFEMNAELPTAQGMWPAFWMVGTNTNQDGGDPCDGEIDVMEAVGSDTGTNTLWGTAYGPDSSGCDAGADIWKENGSTTASGDLSAGFHTYGVVWSPGQIQFQLDGTTYETLTKAGLPSGDDWIFDGNTMYIILNLAVGGSWPGPPDAMTTFPQKELINWVKVYTYN
jgi:beta-glucanase (GH16 family)